MIGNIRDYADILHLVVLSNLKVLNVNTIENNISQKERLEKLKNTAKKQLETLINDKNIIGVGKYDNNQRLIAYKNQDI